ncbi:hypothetical protein KKF38_02200 [Patescibacteria group bacterium]|nr:hypothetical protein [Patescibacteria group bacterium]
MKRAAASPKFRKIFRKLPKHVQKSFFRHIAKLPSSFPFNDPQVKKLRKPLAGFRLRIGDYRFIFDTEGDKVIFRSVATRGHSYNKKK